MKAEKGYLDLKELKRVGKRILWSDSIGCNIYYDINNKNYIFTLKGYNKDEQKAIILYDNKEYCITTSSIIGSNLGNIIGGCVKDFRYEIDDIVITIKKKCKILDKFRNKKGKKTYKCECVDCGNIRDVPEDYLVYKGFTCNVCSDKISYPERFFGALLNQLNAKYEYQKEFSWSKSVKFICDDKFTKKVYDFYIPEYNMIIETHGEMHYKEGRWSNSRPLTYIKENDKYKEKLALSNGIKYYIVIDCKESNLHYIKNSILNSSLIDFFDFSEVDWNKCSLDAMTSLMKICSDLWNGGIRSTQSIADRLGISKPTVITYLKKFSQLGLNDYNPKEEMRTGLGKTPNSSKGIIILKDGVCLGKFKSASELSRKSIDLYNIRLTQPEVSRVARGERRQCKGYVFKYIENLSKEELIKYKI